MRLYKSIQHAIHQPLCQAEQQETWNNIMIYANVAIRGWKSGTHAAGHDKLKKVWNITGGMVSIFQKLLVCWNFPKHPSLGLTENGPLMPEVRVERREKPLYEGRKATVTQIATCYKQGMQKSISDLKADELHQQKTTPGASPVS